MLARIMRRRNLEPPAMQGFSAPQPEVTERIVVRIFVATGTVTGSYALRADRLTDAVNHSEGVTLDDATVLEFATLAERTVPVFNLHRSNILLVAVAGRRGNPDRWFKTWPHQITVTLQGYRVEGIIHTVLCGHPTAGVFHRKPMIPLTEATLSYEIMGRPIIEYLDTVLINRDRIHSIARSEDPLARRLRARSVKSGGE